jgi:hypothetical protein
VLHSFWNKGETARIHILLDLMKVETYNQAVNEGIDLNTLTIDAQVTDPKEILGENYLED